MTDSPILSVVVPVWHPKPEHLRECIDSVLGQTTGVWELILVCDGPQPPEVTAELVSDDPRIRVLERAEQGGIVAASNDGIEAASGEFLVFLDNDDVLPDYALGAVAWELDRWDDVDVLYTDEDKIDDSGKHFDPFHKPAWSPERLRSQMYLGHLCVYRRTLVEELGRLREDYNGSQDHDLALRATERARRIIHLPRVCYHWRATETSTAHDASAKDWAFEAGVRAVQSHLGRTGVEATAARHPTIPGIVVSTPTTEQAGLVSIIMPTSGSAKRILGEMVPLADNAIASIVERSTAHNYEIVVVLDSNGTDEVAERISQVAPDRVRVVRDPEPFHFSGACNTGAYHARGQTLIFLNDDTEVVTTDWIERLTLWANLEGVGAVGAKLLFGDGRVQHGGIFARSGAPGHRYFRVGKDTVGSMGFLELVSNVVAVTGACLAVRADRFMAVGGFTMQLPLNFNDVDFCFKLLREGWRNVLDCNTVMTHYESATREAVVRQFELDFMEERWWDILSHDPYDNPHLYGYGQEEIPPPAVLTMLRERNGSTIYHGRSWPLVGPELNPL